MKPPEIKISPSMMCADFIRMKEELDLFKKSGVNYLHIDIMDGHYVPNLTLGVDFAKSLYDYSGIPLDFHLMVEDPDRMIDIFTVIKGSILTIHPETTWHPDRSLRKIRELGCIPGLAIDPAIPIGQFRHLYPLVDLVLVMAVNPGYAGQPVIPYAFDKIRELRQHLVENNLNIDIEVDGHVSWEHIPTMIHAGANVLVAGTSSLFQQGISRKEALQLLLEMIGKQADS
jgi:ribulose-phosphate 3-epimerase